MNIEIRSLVLCSEHVQGDITTPSSYYTIISEVSIHVLNLTN